MRSKVRSQLLDELHPVKELLIASDVYPLLGRMWRLRTSQVSVQFLE